MNRNEQHIVGKINIRLEVHGQKGLHALMDRLSTRAKDVVTQSIEQWWQNTGQAGTICLDSIKLDLGEVPSSRIARNLETELSSAIKRSLYACSKNTDEDTSHVQSRRSVEYSDPFIYFVKHGTLPWNASAKTFNLEIALKQSMQGTGQAEWKKVLHYRQVRERLSYLLPEQQFYIFLKFLDQELTETWLQIGSEVEELLNDWFTEEDRKFRWTPLFAQALLEMFILQKLALNRIVRFWLTEYKKQLKLPVLRDFEKFVQNLVTGTGDNAKTLATLDQKAVWDGLIRSTEGQMDDQDTDLKNKNFTTPIKILPLNEYYISNAGLAILWPGLRHLFTECGLVIKDQFVNEDCRRRAVFLLNYLCTGSKHCNEYDLVFNKILCGLEAEQVLNMHLVLTKEERSVADLLRKEVHSTWEATKKLSEKELIHNFFMREGKLSRRDNGWLLQVEHQVWDVLLDKLPWGIGIVKLPWMNNMIYTEW